MNQNDKRVEPTLHLYAGFRYTDSANTDIRKTFERARVALEAQKDRSSETAYEDAPDWWKRF